MKKHVLFLFATLLSLAASAQDFEVGGIYYNITSETDHTVEVTYKGDLSYYYNEYSGSITIPATVTYDGVAYSVTSIGQQAFASCSSLTAITIPESVTSIGNGAFACCSSLTAITFPEGVTSIGDDAFSLCSSLTTITLPEGVTSIASSAFYGCSSLTAITLPEGVTSIGDYAFCSCSSLTDITISEGVTSIGYQAFCGCSSLTAITIPEDSKLTSIGNEAFSGCSSLTTITIPESVTSIGEWAFSRCSCLTAITIPEGMTSIGGGAFAGCDSLIAVHISSLEVWCNIDFASSSANPLYYAKNLYLNGELVTELTIPNSVTAIKDYAFDSYPSLTAITIPEDSKLTSIGYDAFYDCSSLKTVINYSDLPLQRGSSYGYVAYYADRVINVDEVIDGYAFKTIEGVHYLTGYIGDKTELTLPATYKGENYQIGERAFYGCSSLTAIVLPKSVEYIYSEAFADCSELTDVYCYAETVPGTEADAFNGSDIEYATLHVPERAVESYKSITPWSNFGKIVPLTEEEAAISNAQSSRIKVQGHHGTLRITGAAEGDAISVYATGGTLVAQESAEGAETLITLPTGQVYIVTVADTVVKIGM